jgi:hypothetical protein
MSMLREWDAQPDRRGVIDEAIGALLRSLKAGGVPSLQEPPAAI